MKTTIVDRAIMMGALSKLLPFSSGKVLISSVGENRLKLISQSTKTGVTAVCHIDAITHDGEFAVDINKLNAFVVGSFTEKELQFSWKGTFSCGRNKMKLSYENSEFFPQVFEPSNDCLVASLQFNNFQNLIRVARIANDPKSVDMKHKATMLVFDPAHIRAIAHNGIMFGYAWTDRTNAKLRDTISILVPSLSLSNFTDNVFGGMVNIYVSGTRIFVESSSDKFYTYASSLVSDNYPTKQLMQMLAVEPEYSMIVNIGLLKSAINYSVKMGGPKLFVNIEDGSVAHFVNESSNEGEDARVDMQVNLSDGTTRASKLFAMSPKASWQIASVLDSVDGETASPDVTIGLKDGLIFFLPRMPVRFCLAGMTTDGWKEATIEDIVEEF